MTIRMMMRRVMMMLMTTIIMMMMILMIISTHPVFQQTVVGAGKGDMVAHANPGSPACLPSMVHLTPNWWFKTPNHQPKPTIKR